MEAPLANNVLVVDDDADTRSNLRDILELDDYRVETAGSVAETLARSDWAKFSVIILDWSLPDGDGETLLPRLRERAPDAAVIVSTGAVGLEAAVTALRHGAADYILKPIDPAALRGSLARVAQRSRLALEKAQSDSAFRTLVEAAPSMIVIVRPDAAVLYFNPFAQRLSGYSAGEVHGKSYFDALVHEAAVRDQLSKTFRRVLAGQSTRGFEHLVHCRDGSLRWMVWNAERLDNYEGGAAILVIGQDITELREAQERALQSERLAAIGEAMAGLTHESRNALQRSQACLEMLAGEVRDRPAAMDLIARIQKAQDDLHRLYEEVREYAAPLKLNQQPCSLAAIVMQAWSELEPLRQGRVAELCQRDGGADLNCVVDRFAMEQVFRNLFENSLAACRDPVRIEVCFAAAQLAGRPAVKAVVRDNGPGLSAALRRRVFDAFFTTKTKGTGLGMAIARRIVEAHDGRIGVGDEAGSGAEFVILLPRRKL